MMMKKSLLWQSVALVDSQLWLAVITGNPLPWVQRVLYSTANDPQPQMIPRPQMIPKMDRKWSSTASDPQSRPQMIPKEK